MRAKRHECLLPLTRVSEALTSELDRFLAAHRGNS
jgi:hypothetical protein